MSKSKFPKPARVYENAKILADIDEKGFIDSTEKQLIILFADGRKPTMYDYDTKSFIDKEDAVEYARIHARHVWMSVGRKTNLVGQIATTSTNLVELKSHKVCERCKKLYHAGDKVLKIGEYLYCPKDGGWVH